MVIWRPTPGGWLRDTQSNISRPAPGGFQLAKTEAGQTFKPAWAINSNQVIK